MHWEQRLRTLASEQAGAVGIDQLRSIDCDWNHWARARRNGRWGAASRRVLIASGAPPCDAQRMWGALLDVGGGAHLHGPSTLAWFGLRGYNPTESRNEDQLEAVLRRSGLPAFERQVVVGADKPIGRCDFRDPEFPMVLEVNSLSFHSTPSDQQNDERRYAALVESGFGVAVVWEPDLWTQPSNVTRTVKTARTHASDAIPVVVHSASCPWPVDPERIIIPARTPDLRG